MLLTLYFVPAVMQWNRGRQGGRQEETELQAGPVLQVHAGEQWRGRKEEWEEKEKEEGGGRRRRRRSGQAGAVPGTSPLLSLHSPPSGHAPPHAVTICLSLSLSLSVIVVWDYLLLPFCLFFPCLPWDGTDRTSILPAQFPFLHHTPAYHLL